MSLPPLGRTALLLDLDGTLLDFAPAPDLVVVPPALIDALRHLRERLDDALAVITGRPIGDIDRLLGDLPFAVAGEHGGAIRHAPGAAQTRPALAEMPADWLPAAQALKAATPGVLLEKKARGFVLHFRAVPDAGPALRTALDRIIAGVPGFAVLHSAMAWEVRPSGVHKGTAVEALMQTAPFAGRLPLFIGDDVTDMDAIVAARTLGGAGLKVDEAFGGPVDVRAWLAAAAEEADWPGLPLG